MSLRIGVIEPYREPYLKTVEPDKDGSYLSALQREVGGDIEPFDLLFHNQPTLFVNDVGLYTEQPNRAIYATAEMAEIGYYSQMDYRTVVQPGDLYTILFGTIIAVSFGEEGEARDITDAEFAKVYDMFASERSQYSGYIEVLKIRGAAGQEGTGKGATAAHHEER